MRSNPAKAAGGNPQPKRDEVVPFEPDEVESIAAELGSVYGPLAIVAAYAGLRPSEWTALEWKDVDRSEGVLRVERAYSYGVLKPPKTKGSRRRVPLPARAAEALETLPRRLHTRLVFPAPRESYIDLRNWRKREYGVGDGGQRSKRRGCGHRHRRDSRFACRAHARTTFGTRTRPACSPPAFRPTTWPDTWAPRCE